MEEDVKTTEIDQATQPIAFAQQTRADRLREASSAPDFSIPEIRPVDDFFSESVMTMDDETLKDMMRETGIYSSTSEQTATAISNAFIGMNQLADETKIAYGNLVNYLTGSKIGDELAQIAYESIAQRYSEMANAEEAIGGIRSNLAQLAGGATSFVQLALEGLATAGALPLAHIGIQEFGQGTYNDMKAYADKNDGSLKGYEPKGGNLAVNTANALLQVGIESWLGVGSPRFLVGASRGAWIEGLSGALQEGVQGALSDLAEVVKGNEEISILLDNAEDYLRDAIIGGILQGSLGAVTHHQNYARAVDYTSQAIAKTRGHEQPTAEDQQQAKAIIDAKERQESSVLTKEFKAAFNASTGEGQLQQKIVGALKKAVEAKELDLDTTNETELAQRLEGIATQETLNAMDFAKEQNRAISDMELNNIVYKDGAIWLEGVTPELGDRAVSYARVLAERQSGLAEVNMKLDTINQEIATLKKDLAEAKQQKQEARAQVLQARIDKQNALAEKNRIRAEKLKAQTAKLEKQIAKQEEKAKIAEPVKTEKVSAEEVKPVEVPKREVLAQVKKKEPVAERKSLKEERVEKKKTKAEKETEQKLADVYNKIMAQAKQVAKKQLSKISQEEKAQANKTTYTDKGEFFSKSKGDVYIRIIPQIDDVTNTYVVKYQTYARNTDTERISNNLGNYTGEFRLGSAGWGKRELADTKERLEKIVNKMINDFGEEYAFFDMEHTDDSLKYLAEGHQQEEPEALKYKNQELRDLEQQGFEEQYKIKTGKEWEGRKTPSVDDEGLLHQVKPEKYEGDTIEVDGKERTVYNSNGDRIAKSKEALTNFWRWFGDSKVVDEQGRPLVVYHGARGKTDITEFKPKEYGYNVEATYFATNKRAAGHWAESSYTKRNINPDEYMKRVYETNSVKELLDMYNSFGAKTEIVEYDGFYRLNEHDDMISSPLGKKITESTFEVNGRTIDLVKELQRKISRIIYDSANSDLYSVYAKLENPLIVDAKKQPYRSIGFNGEKTTTATIAQFALDNNYDGLIIKNVYETDYENVLTDDVLVFEPTQIKSVDNRGTFSEKTGNILKQGSISGKGDTNRGGYDEQLKRIILGEKSDLSTIQHEFAHYWMQNNFKWARSGLASQDWLRRWRDVEEWLGIEPQDRLLSKSASEKFAKAYERYILEGKVAPELQWAFEGFQKAYQDIYSELENEYFDLSEELAPEVVDWFNRNKEQSPKRLLEEDTKKLEKALIVNAGGAVTEEVDGNVVMTEQNKEGDPVVYMGIKESEVPAGDNLLVYADKTTASKLQQSAKKILGDSVEVQQLATLDTQKTLNNFKDWIARDRQGAWNAMMNPDTRPVYRTYLYKAFAEEAMNDVDLAMELANIDMAQSVREMGQAIQALDIRNLSGFDTIEIIRNIEKSKGKLSAEELNKSVESIGLDMIELSQEDINEIEFDTECKL